MQFKMEKSRYCAKGNLALDPERNLVRGPGDFDAKPEDGIFGRFLSGIVRELVKKWRVRKNRPDVEKALVNARALVKDKCDSAKIGAGVEKADRWFQRVFQTTSMATNMLKAAS